MRDETCARHMSPLPVPGGPVIVHLDLSKGGSHSFPYIVMICSGFSGLRNYHLF